MVHQFYIDAVEPEDQPPVRLYRQRIKPGKLAFQFMYSPAGISQVFRTAGNAQRG
jgi:hypothetical protein